MRYKAEKVLELAVGYLGSRDGDGFIERFNNMCGWGLGKGNPWCAVFFCVVHHMAGADVERVPWFTGCITAKRLYKNMGRWAERGCVPRPGWGVIFDWDEVQGNGEDHIGIVERVEGDRLYTIEGNSGEGVVARKEYGLCDPVIAGYCEISFDKEEEMTYEQWVEYMNRYEKEKGEKPASGWAAEAVGRAQEKGVMLGDPEGGFRPQSYVTRQELAMVVSRLGVDFSEG